MGGARLHSGLRGPAGREGAWPACVRAARVDGPPEEERGAAWALVLVLLRGPEGRLRARPAGRERGGGRAGRGGCELGCVEMGLSAGAGPREGKVRLGRGRKEKERGIWANLEGMQLNALLFL